MSKEEKPRTPIAKLPISLEALSIAASRNLERFKRDLAEAPKLYADGDGVEEVALDRLDDHLGLDAVPATTPNK